MVVHVVQYRTRTMVAYTFYKKHISFHSFRWLFNEFIFNIANISKVNQI